MRAASILNIDISIKRHKGLGQVTDHIPIQADSERAAQQQESGVVK